MAASLWWDDPTAQQQYRNDDNKNDDLLVFGYACKLFRDNQKARDIDKGKLLIPWMGDERLMIDRSVISPSQLFSKIRSFGSR